MNKFKLIEDQKQDFAASDEAGYPVYKTIYVLEIAHSNGTSQFFADKWLRSEANKLPTASDEFKSLYYEVEKQHNALMAVANNEMEGDLLKHWVGINKKQLKQCQDANIYTIQQLAEAESQQLQGLIDAARNWLDDAKETGKLLAEVNKLKKQLTNEKAQHKRTQMDLAEANALLAKLAQDQEV